MIRCAYYQIYRLTVLTGNSIPDKLQCHNYSQIQIKSMHTNITNLTFLASHSSDHMILIAFESRIELFQEDFRRASSSACFFDITNQQQSSDFTHTQ